jgi:hypothetical protein
MTTLNPKSTPIHTADYVYGQWAVRLPAECSYGDVFDRRTWLEIEQLMRQRGGRSPRKDDLVRLIGADFDVVCVVTSVSDGYGLRYFAGRQPAAIAQVLRDLDGLKAIDDQDILKARAKSLSLRWQAVGANKQDLAAARRRFAQQTHPDTTNPLNAPRLVTANALIDAAMESLQEPA